MAAALTADVTFLLAAVDAGEDCLPQLVDALEEAGDPRAVGSRQALAKGLKPRQWQVATRSGYELWWGYAESVIGASRAWVLSGEVWRRLAADPGRYGLWNCGINATPLLVAGGRGVAFLALAAALPDPPEENR